MVLLYFTNYEPKERQCHVTLVPTSIEGSKTVLLLLSFLLIPLFFFLEKTLNSFTLSGLKNLFNYQEKVTEMAATCRRTQTEKVVNPPVQRAIFLVLSVQQQTS